MNRLYEPDIDQRFYGTIYCRDTDVGKLTDYAGVYVIDRRVRLVLVEERIDGQSLTGDTVARSAETVTGSF